MVFAQKQQNYKKLDFYNTLRESGENEFSFSQTECHSVFTPIHSHTDFLF